MRYRTGDLKSVRGKAALTCGRGLSVPVQGSGRRDGGRGTKGVWDQGVGGCFVSESRQHLGNLEGLWAVVHGTGQWGKGLSSGERDWAVG